MAEDRTSDSLSTGDETPAEPSISDAELTELALKYPAPDDFRVSEANADRSPWEAPKAHNTWFVGLLVIGLLGILLGRLPNAKSHEIERERSPDGAGDAILMEFPQVDGDSKSFKVCIQSPSGTRFIRDDCREVAYLGGVISATGSQPVRLVWNTSSQLEIHYSTAASVHVYRPDFVWGSTPYATRVGSFRPVHVVAVQMDQDGGIQRSGSE